MRQLFRWTFLWLLMAGAAGPALAAQAREAARPAIYSNRYEIRFMNLHAAEALAWEQCGKEIKEQCRVTALSVPNDEKGRAYLEVYGDAATHERLARALAEADARPTSRSFHILLLAGRREAASATPSDLPQSAQKAIADIREFLPYKSYEVLDSAWVRSTGSADVRMSGRDGVEYEVDMIFHAPGASSKELFVNGFRLFQAPGFGTPQPAAKEDAGKPAAAPRPGRNLLQTSFGMNVGETVVVGTSKVDGSDEALIVLLTAVP